LRTGPDEGRLWQLGDKRKGLPSQGDTGGDKPGSDGGPQKVTKKNKRKEKMGTGGRRGNGSSKKISGRSPLRRGRKGGLDVNSTWRKKALYAVEQRLEESVGLLTR